MVAAYNATLSQRQTLASAKASNISSMNMAQSRLNSAVENVKGYEASLASAQANLALKKAPASTFDIETARANLAQARASLSAAQVNFEKTRISAPFEGTIAQATGKVGQTVSQADIIMKLHGADVYEIEADVPETDVSKLSVGMDASITLDAYGSDKHFPAKLSSIDTAETVIQDIVYYKTRLLLVSPDMPVRAGMTASVTVTTAKKDDVLFIPVRAVRALDGGKKYVRTLENDQVKDIDVTVGLRGDANRIEIVSGLTEGQVIILAVRENGKIQ
jgi:HlyD family secretion protein